MHKNSLVRVLGWATLLLSMGSFAAGCDYLFWSGTPSYTCDPDDELPEIHEGAICKVDRLECPDGSAPCDYLKIVGGEVVLRDGCLGECIDCPVGTGICYYHHPETQELDFVCVKNQSYCFEDWGYTDLPHSMDACPTAANECLKGRD